MSVPFLFLPPFFFLSSPNVIGRGFKSDSIQAGDAKYSTIRTRSVQYVLAQYNTYSLSTYIRAALYGDHFRRDRSAQRSLH